MPRREKVKIEYDILAEKMNKRDMFFNQLQMFYDKHKYIPDEHRKPWLEWIRQGKQPWYLDRKIVKKIKKAAKKAAVNRARKSNEDRTQHRETTESNRASSKEKS